SATSGGLLSTIVARPATTATTPQRRQGPRHKHSHSPPNEISSRPSAGNRGTAQTLPGRAETCCATQIVRSIPQPIGSNAKRSRPNGISRQATTPHGRVHIALNGTATTLASGEYSPMGGKRYNPNATD